MAGYTPLTLDATDGLDGAAAAAASIVRKTTVLDVMRRLLQVGLGGAAVARRQGGRRGGTCCTRLKWQLRQAARAGPAAAGGAGRGGALHASSTFAAEQQAGSCVGTAKCALLARCSCQPLRQCPALPPPPPHPCAQPKNLMVSAAGRAKDYDKSKYISILNIIQVCGCVGGVGCVGVGGWVCVCVGGGGGGGL